MTAMAEARALDGREVNITRIFDAPRTRVFEAWTSAEHLTQWFCPADFTVLACDVDLRPGGVFTVRMRSPDGLVFEWRNTYREIVVPERLVYASTISDGEGAKLFDVLTSVAFADAGEGTELSVQSAIERLHDPEAAAFAAAMEPGWHDGLDNLAAFLNRG